MNIYVGVSTGQMRLFYPIRAVSYRDRDTKRFNRVTNYYYDDS